MYLLNLLILLPLWKNLLLCAYYHRNMSVFVLQEELRTGERAVVCFRFLKHPEYLRVGAKLLFREGVTKGIGHVTHLLPSTQNHVPDQNHNQNHT